MYIPLCPAGDHLCEVRPALHGPGSVVGGPELPSYRHPQSHDSGREVGGLHGGRGRDNTF